MEKIVRKILNYIPDDSVSEDRDEFMANVIALSLFLLEKKPQFNFPNNCANVIFKKMIDINAGQYNPFNKALNYDKNIFMFGDDYCSDLPLLAHEVCHLAQDISGNGVDQKHMTYLYPDEFKYFMHMLDKHNRKKHILNKQEFKEVCDFYDSFYYLQKNEFEAFCFSVEFLNVIINVAEKIKNDAKLGKTKPLSDQEEKTLFDITYDSAIVPFVEKLMYFKRLHQDEKVTKNIKLLSNSFLTTFFKKHPNWQKEFLENDMIEHDVPNIIFASMIGILMVDYNDQLAHEYFNLLAQSRYELKYQEMVFLVQKTKIQLTKTEEILFHKALKDYNMENDTQLTYDMVKSEKIRLQKEFNSIAGKEEVM